MDSFPDLRTFLLLRDPVDTKWPKSAFGSSTSQLGWRRGLSSFEVAIHVYDVAQASWELFGDEGPPIGTQVQMLEAGHGGHAGAIRTFNGVYQRDPRFFCVARDAKAQQLSLVERSQWWLHFRPYKDDDFDKEMF